MSAQLAPVYEADNVVELPDSPGRRLRIIRQARGLDLDRVANELRLRPAQITAMEQDDYGALPGPVYVVGYMRNYARLLGLDPEPLIGAYRASNLQAESPPPAQERAGGGRAVRRLASLAVLAVLAGLGYLWWENQDPGGSPAFLAAPPSAGGAGTASVDSGPNAAPEPPPAVSQKAAGGADAGDAKPVAAAPPTAEVKPAATASVEPAAAHTAPVAPAAEDGDASEHTALRGGEAADAGGEAGDTAVPGTGARGEVLMEFTGPCWVEVRDGDRKVRISGIMQKGDRRVLEGTPPFSVKLGNAGAAKITVAGAPFDLKAVTRGSKARFTLDPD